MLAVSKEGRHLGDKQELGPPGQCVLARQVISWPGSNSVILGMDFPAHFCESKETHSWFV